MTAAQAILFSTDTGSAVMMHGFDNFRITRRLVRSGQEVGPTRCQKSCCQMEKAEVAMSLWPAQAVATSAERTAPFCRPMNCKVLRQHRTSPSVRSASVASACRVLDQSLRAGSSSRSAGLAIGFVDCTNF